MVTESESQRAAEADLVREHLPLVGQLVRELLARVPNHVQRDDLVSAGMLALVQAARSYADTYGVPFGRFASCRVRGALLDELRGMDWASRSVRRRAREIESVRNQLAGALGRTPTKREIAAGSGISVTALSDHDCDVARANVSSIHAFEDGEEPRMSGVSTLEPVDVLMHREKMAYLADAVQELPARLRRVVEGYFLHERPMAELAAELGVTESRISQMRAEALALMRHALDALLEKEHTTDGQVAGIATRRRAAYVREVAGVRPARARLAQLHRAELSYPA